MQDAEDIVQDTFLKWLTVDQKKIENTKSYLVRAVINNCINHLNSFKEKKKEYLDAISSSEFFEKYDLSHLDIGHEVSEALATVVHKLGPLEKAVFLLREVFDFEYEDLQELFNKKKDHCRQLFHRAKEKLSGEQARDFNPAQHRHLLQNFKEACSLGQISKLIEHFISDVKMK